ncbi:MAG TPA: NmrA family NAD(P)-binding protein, partial [Mariniphaga sp.]|nr:NmrA family NAD(P)-binding protein [Mariniphaga sp.]
MMILITGATGHLGSQVIEFLLEKKDPASIAALVRDDSKAGDLIAKGVDVRVGNYDGKRSLEDAFEGIETLLLVSRNGVKPRQQQHFNAINAAKKAGVQYVIYTSFDRKK